MSSFWHKDQFWQSTGNFQQNSQFHDFDNRRFAGFPGFGLNLKKCIKSDPMKWAWFISDSFLASLGPILSILHIVGPPPWFFVYLKNCFKRRGIRNYVWTLFILLYDLYQAREMRVNDCTLMLTSASFINDIGHNNMNVKA